MALTFKYLTQEEATTNTDENLDALKNLKAKLTKAYESGQLDTEQEHKVLVGLFEINRVQPILYSSRAVKTGDKKAKEQEAIDLNALLR